jgi:Na+-transporting NADH:ubiquinone oxidoreductase subunit F
MASMVVFLVLILLFVGLLLFAKATLTPSGKVKIIINEEKELETARGGSLLSTLQSNGIFLSGACGGSGTCGQCRCQIVAGGGKILPTEVGFFSRKQIKDHWRLGCQTKVKEDLNIRVPEEVFGVKEWECEVVSNYNIASFIKELIVKLPKGEHLNFKPGAYIKIKAPKY